MHFLTSLFYLNPRYPKLPLDTKLLGPRIVLRMGTPSDWRHWRALRDSSRDFLVPWEPTWPPNSLSYGHFTGVLRRHGSEWRRGKAYTFFIFTHEATLLGGIALNDVQRGIAQKATLGYWIGKPFAGQGYMTEAVQLICGLAFETLRLHRLEASCLPHNEPSKHLLQRLGFEQEGYAKAYLQINGLWQDHILWGKAFHAGNQTNKNP